MAVFLISGGGKISAQIKISGFIALDYVKSRTSSFTEGSFSNGQTGLVFSGILTENVNWLSEIRAAADKEFSLQQAWIQLAASSLIRPQIGLYLVPFGSYNQASRPHQTALVDFPLPVKYLYPRDWRDLGLVLEGRLLGLNYSAYTGNGTREAEYLSGGQQFEDQNSSKSVGFRLNIPLDSRLNVSYSLYREKYDQDHSRILVMHAVSGGWRTEGFQITGEYYRTDMDNPGDFDAGKAEGYYVQLMVNLGGFRPVGSYQSLVYTDPFHGPGFTSPAHAGAGIDINRSRWTLGINAVLSEKVILKLEYQFDEDESQAEEGRVLLLQAALSF